MRPEVKDALMAHAYGLQSTDWRWRARSQAMLLLAEVLGATGRCSRTGFMVARLEAAFAQYVGAKHAIAMCNGTATLHTALAVGPAQYDVLVPPLTMSATTAAVLAAGSRPAFSDVDPRTWLMRYIATPSVPVSIFGLDVRWHGLHVVRDAAQSLHKHVGDTGFTSYSFQASKHLPAGEGGMLVTNDDGYADEARSFASLGYDLAHDRPRIDTRAIRSPEAVRHVRFGVNYRMNDLTAAVVLAHLEQADAILAERRACAELYRQAHQGCTWLTPQAVPEGSEHAYWCYPLLISEGVPGYERGTSQGHINDCFGYPIHFGMVANSVVAHGGERPYAAWRLTYDEPAFKHLKPKGGCPVAESIQPRLMQFQTNRLAAAEINAEALAKAIREIGG